MRGALALSLSHRVPLRATGCPADMCTCTYYRASANTCICTQLHPEILMSVPGFPTVDPRTRRLLEAPIVPLLLRMAAPNVLVLLAQSAAGLIETYFIGRLGVEALGGVALVFPVVMLMQMLSGGAIGGGISSSIARALGGRRNDEANDLALHAVAIAVAF